MGPVSEVTGLRRIVRRDRKVMGDVSIFRQPNQNSSFYHRGRDTSTAPNLAARANFIELAWIEESASFFFLELSRRQSDRPGCLNTPWTPCTRRPVFFPDRSAARKDNASRLHFRSQNEGRSSEKCISCTMARMSLCFGISFEAVESVIHGRSLGFSTGSDTRACVAYPNLSLRTAAGKAAAPSDLKSRYRKVQPLIETRNEFLLVILRTRTRASGSSAASRPPS